MNLKEMDVAKFTKVMNEAVLDIFTVFETKYKSNSEDGYYMLYGCVYAPITFAMNMFNRFDAMGVDPSEQCPNFMYVYVNYLKSLEKLAPLWGKVPFKEFEAQFINSYQKSGFDVFRSENGN